MQITSLCLIKESADCFLDSDVIVQEWSFEWTGNFDLRVMKGGEDGGFTWPIVGDAYDYDTSSSGGESSSLFCVNAKYEHDADTQSKIGRIIAQFKPDTLAGASPEVDHCSYTYQTESRDVAVDKDDKAFATTAGQIYAQPGRTQGSVTGCTITGYRDTATLPPITDWTIVNTSSVSLPAGVTLAAGEAAIVSASADPVYVNGLRKWKHVWQLAFRESHDLVVPNVGTLHRVLGDGPAIPIWRGGKFVTEPWPLDSFGEALPEDFDPVDIINLNFDVTVDYDFAAFGWDFGDWM
jgi:hypothetical protein